MGKTVRAVSHVEDDHAADSNIEAAVNAALAKKEDMFEKLLQTVRQLGKKQCQGDCRTESKRSVHAERNRRHEVSGAIAIGASKRQHPW